MRGNANASEELGTLRSARLSSARLGAAKRWGAALVAMIALLLTAGSSWAQKPPPEVRRAKALFEEGIALSDEGKWSEALAAFQKSDELVPSSSVRFNVAATLRALGRYVEAKEALEAILEGAERSEREAADRARGQGAAARAPKPPALKPELNAQVKQLLGEVKEKIVTLSVRLSPVDADLEIDGAPAVQLASGRLELDPGRHVFVIRAKGHDTTTVTKTLSAADKEIALTAPKTKAAVVERRVEVKVAEDTPFFKRVWFWTAVGAVVAGGVVVTVVLTRPDAAEPAGPPPSTVDRVIPATVRF